jgi:hypothetical protein
MDNSIQSEGFPVLSYRISEIELTTDKYPSHYHISKVLCNWIDPVTDLSQSAWLDREFVADAIDDKSCTAYITTEVTVATVTVEHYKNGQKFLRTQHDGINEDNLLSLPTTYA